MSALQALLLGLIQGVTEFAPISSSAHLVLVPWLLGWEVPGLAFDTTLHLGTLAAVLVFFHSDFLRLGLAFLASIRERTLAGEPERKVAWALLIGILPAAILGLLFEDFFASLFLAPIWSASFLLVTGLILLFSEWRGRLEREMKEITFLDSLLIGLAQGCALAPGLSRSGMTMGIGIWRGLKRGEAARYSFLLATPVIFGAGLLQLLRLMANPPSSGALEGLALGFLVAAFSGYFCIKYLLSYLERGRFYPFVAYCWLLGGGILAAILAGSYGRAEPVPPPPIVMAGSDCIRQLGEELAESYAQAHPALFHIKSGGMEAGLKALREGRVDIALVSRELEREEGEGLLAMVIAQDGLAILVNPANKLDSLSLEEVRTIFEGRILGWEEVGGEAGEIMVTSYEDGSEVHRAFEEMLMGERRVTPRAIVVPDGEAMIEWVAKHPQAIGYASMGYLGPGVKALQLEGISLDGRMVEEGRYPLVHPFIFLIGEEARQEVRDFIDFILGSAGQAIVGNRYGRAR